MPMSTQCCCKRYCLAVS